MADQTQALQAALAGEHAALYAIGVAGGHLRGARFRAAVRLSDRHRERRDQLSGMISAAGAEPVAAAAAYDLPAVVSTPARAAALVRLVEQRLGVVYGDLVETAVDTRVRTFAVAALIETARDHALWGGTAVAFPGSVS